MTRSDHRRGMNITYRVEQLLIKGRDTRPSVTTRETWHVSGTRPRPLPGRPQLHSSGGAGEAIHNIYILEHLQEGYLRTIQVPCWSAVG